jgi:hypothetical protein
VHQQDCDNHVDRYDQSCRPRPYAQQDQQWRNDFTDIDEIAECRWHANLGKGTGYKRWSGDDFGDAVKENQYPQSNPKKQFCQIISLGCP